MHCVVVVCARTNMLHCNAMQQSPLPFVQVRLMLYQILLMKLQMQFAQNVKQPKTFTNLVKKVHVLLPLAVNCFDLFYLGIVFFYNN